MESLITNGACVNTCEQYWIVAFCKGSVVNVLAQNTRILFRSYDFQT